MTAGEQSGNELPTPGSMTLRLEDLIPIAVVIAAGCERCAERMVSAALEHGTARLQIERTLRIVEHVRTRECFAQVVGPEVVARMAKPLAAGKKYLRASDPAPEGSTCCR
jgi:hypothetical protein